MSIISRSEEPTSIVRSVLDEMLGEASNGGRSAMGIGKVIAVSVVSLAGLTAASVGISALRRREEQAKDGS